MSEIDQGNEPQQIEEVQMTRELAIQQVIGKALTRGCVVKGLNEVVKALEAKKVKWLFLADDCDEQNYRNLVTAMAKQNDVPIIGVESWISLKDNCKIGLNSEKIKQFAEAKGKEVKIKPRCSSCAIIDFGEETEGFKFLQNEVKHK